uniref:Uncharacterized protein n=1 Tax=Vibrio cholerae TaxID=666 RepID=Q06BB4_VIBCL|nr:hypothetical protein [Vibrio cholerae]
MMILPLITTYRTSFHWEIYQVLMFLFMFGQYRNGFLIFIMAFSIIFYRKGRTIVNGLMFLGISFISFIILRRKFSANISLLVILVGVSSPLVILALTTSQTELVTLFIAISITYLWIDWKKGNFFASIPVFAFAVAIKPSNAVIFYSSIFDVLFFRYLRQSGLKEIFMLKNLCVIVFSVFLAFYPYFFAYYHAGNPFFPLFNSLFAAPFYPASVFF